jgi:predicted metal-dependent peptidase
MIEKIVHRNIKDRISNLKVQLMSSHPFFAIFLLNTDLIEDEKIYTAGTDGFNIYYSEKFFAQLTDPEVKAVLLHEVLHMIYSHCSKRRRAGRDPKKWNIAADFGINWEIAEMDESSVKLPNNIIVNGKPFNVYMDRKYRTMYVEQIYDVLPDDMVNNFDIHMDMPDNDEARQKIEDRLLSAYENCKNSDPGKLPGRISRLVNEIKRARVPWTRIFHRYIGSALAREDYSYAHPNRRFIGQELYLPSLLSYKVGTIAVAVDTSGSIGQKELGAFTNELRKLSALVSEVIVMSCDSDVHSFEIIRDMSNFTNAVKSLKGCGGTDFRPPFEMLKKKKIVPELLIYLTDLEGEFPNKSQIKYPVIWVTTLENKAPFGTTIQMRL